jgi:hypothetical protein
MIFHPAALPRAPYRDGLASRGHEVRRSFSAPVQSIGGELVPAEADPRHGNSMRNTVADPSYITADASKSRLDLAHDAGVLESGLDAAETIEARNSLEKMLAHQMAAMHSSTMKLAAFTMAQRIAAAQGTHNPCASPKRVFQFTAWP